MISAFKSHGPDGIRNCIIKDYAYEQAEPVISIFNIFLTSGVVPTMWKDAIITSEICPISIKTLL
jgi:hypothetical protein